MPPATPPDQQSGHHAHPSGPVPILILNWNGLADTIECVNAVLGQQDVDFHVIVADNGSDGDDYARLSERYASDSRVEIRRNEENLGFARGMNVLLHEVLAAPKSGAEFVGLLNNDAVPEPGWLAALIDAARAEGAGAAASRMLRRDDPTRLDNAGHIFLNTGEVLPRGGGQPAASFTEPVDVVGACAGACVFRLDMLEDIGLFDEFFSTGYEDAELGIRAMLAGYRQVYVPGAVVHHRIGASIDKIRDRQYAIRLQVNINYAYLKLMPVAVMAWNAPWVLARTLAMLIVPALTFRWRLFSVQLAALAQSGRVGWQAYLGRKKFGRRRISAMEVIRRQDFFAGVYWAYFKRFVWHRERTIFER